MFGWYTIATDLNFWQKDYHLDCSIRNQQENGNQLSWDTLSQAITCGGKAVYYQYNDRFQCCPNEENKKTMPTAKNSLGFGIHIITP